MILGPSGSSKSSFLRAGLLPRMQRDDREFLVLGGGVCRLSGLSVRHVRRIFRHRSLPECPCIAQNQRRGTAAIYSIPDLVEA